MGVEIVSGAVSKSETGASHLVLRGSDEPAEGRRTRPGAGAAFWFLGGVLNASLLEVAVRRSDADPRLAPYVRQNVALHVTVDSPRHAYGLFCGDSLNVYGERASEIRILLHRIQDIHPDHRAAHLLHTVVHELGHVWAHQLGIKSSSRGGIYHPQRYGRLAEALGLVTERDLKNGLRTIGFTPQAAGEYADIHAEIDSALVIEMAESAVVLSTVESDKAKVIPAPSHICGSCGCTPPRTIRMTRAQWIAGPSTCDVCHDRYVANNSAPRQPPRRALSGQRLAGTTEKGSNRHE